MNLKKIVLVVGAVLAGLYALFTVVYHATNIPDGYCNSCHYISPYVDSWKESNHANVSCQNCHEGRGVLGKMEAKSRGLNHVYLHVTGQQTMPVQARIFEQNCLVCHGVAQNHHAFLAENRSCLECHREAGHKVNLLLEPGAEKVWKQK